MVSSGSVVAAGLFLIQRALTPSALYRPGLNFLADQSYKIPTREAKDLVLARIATGMTATNAMKSVGRAYETWRDWRKNDPVFKEKAASIKAAVRHGLVKESEVPDFPEFCEKYLGRPLPLHHLRAWDVIRGLPPRDMHDSMQYQPGNDPGRNLIINFPPDHAKSTVWNVQYPLWRLVKDPDIRVITVSKNQGMAKKFLSQIKFYLNNENLYPELHAAFAPKGGWKSAEKSDGLAWRENMIYISGRTQAEKDPTVEALGIGGQIYGARADLIILDDIEDYSSAGLYESHAAYIGQDVFSRLDKEHGQLIVLGTRVGVMDIYRYLRDEAKDEDGEPFYSYFAQPAILDGEHGHSSEWKVLWPERMTPKAIASAKAAMTDPRRFQFVYQQHDVSTYATFPAEAVEAAINRRRFHGPMHVGASGHRPKGMHGLYVVGSWDPASSAGYNAMIVAGTDRDTQHRWVMDVWNKKGALPGECIQLLKDWTVTYGINEWRIEKNAVQSFITQLPEIRDFLSGHGCRLVEHQTTNNKWDPSMGVEGTLQPLFLSCVESFDGKYVAKPDGHGLISLPSPRNFRGTTELCEQLKSWEPEAKKLVQDLVMALWFAELGLRQYLRGGIGQLTHLKSRYTSRGATERRVSYSIEDLHDKGLINAL
jgi:hypothetical protein